MARWALTAIALFVLGACVPICGIGAHVALSNARVDSVYSCPNPSTDRPYDVHASIDFDNSTNNTLTIKSITEAWQLVATAGNWDGPKSDKGTSTVKTYSPKSIAAGGMSTVRFTIPFKCTNSNPQVTTYGEFTFKFTVVTSNATYKVDSGNRHRLTFASG